MVNDLDGKEFQLKFVRAAQMILFANIVCDPPLGQTTVVPHGRDAVRLFVSAQWLIPYLPCLGKIHRFGRVKCIIPRARMGSGAVA